MFRSAQRWHDAVRKCRLDGRQTDYHEVRYEELVDHPVETLRGICGFLGIRFEESMTSLKQPADRRTDAGDRLDVLKHNYGKWKTVLSAKETARIEGICGNLLKELGYETSYPGPVRRIGSLRMKQYQLMDAYSLLRFEIRENGLSEGLRNMVRTKQYSRYRTAGSEEDS
jgi:hypothetical protein